jgi:F-type H+-transporting ATPase subunit delta
VGGIAGRYATAIYELADEAKALDDVARELTDLRDLIAANEALSKLVRSPLITIKKKQAAMAAILEKAGASVLVARFIAVIAQNGRLFATTEIINAFLAELARRRGEVKATVTAARTLNENQTQTVMEILRQMGGDKVTMDVEIDPSLIGGVVVRVGSRMIDSSLKSKLQRMQLAMKGA